MFISTLTFWSCDKDIIDESKVKFTEVEIPAKIKASETLEKSTGNYDKVVKDMVFITNEGKELEGKVRLTMPYDCSESLYNLELTDNFFDETDLSTDFWVIYENETKSSKGPSYSECAVQCDDNYNDEEHYNHGNGTARRRCIARCWVDVMVEVITGII